MSPEEFQIWSIFNSFRIGSALAFVASAIFIWLGFRIAVGTRVPASGEEPTMFGKIISSIFCGIIVLGTWIQFTEAVGNYIASAFAFEQLKEAGTEISPVAEGWINYVGTTDATFTPTPLGMAFLAIVAIMYAAIIWYPKQK